MENSERTLGEAVLYIGLGIVATILHGVVLKITWTWFLVPLGLPVISVAHAIGIALIASYLTKNDDYAAAEMETHILAAKYLIKPVVFFIFAWIVHLFM